MSSPYRLNSHPLGLSGVFIAALALASCDEDKKPAALDPPIAQLMPETVAVSGLFPADGGARRPPTPRGCVTSMIRRRSAKARDFLAGTTVLAATSTAAAASAQL